MNLQSLKQRFSLRSISERMRMTVSRFPLALIFLVLLTGFLSALIWRGKEPEFWMMVAIYYLAVGIVLDFALSLWGEEQPSRKMRYIVRCVVLGLWTAYCLWFETMEAVKEEYFTEAFGIGNAAWIAAILLVVPFVAFLRSKDDIKAWHLLSSICWSLIVSGIIAGVMTGGIMGLYAGIQGLFDVKIPEKVYAITSVISSLLLAGVLFFYQIPYGEAKHNRSTEMPRFLLSVLRWLILPLLCCYIIVLYVYMATIIIHWELPNGMISWLVSVVMIGYGICYIILHPQFADSQSRLTRFMTRWLPVIILPLLVLMTVGVVRRFADYGITAPRLYLATLLAWYYAICLLVLFLPRKRFRWIFFSLALLLVLTSGHPMHYYRLCRPVFEAKIEKTIAEKGLQLPLPFTQDALENNPLLTKEEAKQLYDNLEYMRSTYGRKSVERWVGTIEEKKEKETEKDAKRIQIWECKHSGMERDDVCICPQGFNTFQQKSQWIYYEMPADSLYDGSLHVSMRAGDDFVVLLFDTATIRQAAEKKDFVVTPSSDGKAVFVLSEFNATGYNDNTIRLYRYRGYLFYNE